MFMYCTHVSERRSLQTEKVSTPLPVQVQEVGEGAHMDVSAAKSDVINVVVAPENSQLSLGWTVSACRPPSSPSVILDKLIMFVPT